MKIAAVAITVGLALLAASPTEDAWPDPLIHETFEDGAEGWTYTDASAWKVQEDDGDQALCLHGASDYEPPVRSPRNMARIDGVNLTDFTLDVRLKQTGREYGHRDMCVFFGYQGPDRFYYVHFAPKADAHANSIFIVNGAPRTSIAKERTDGSHWEDGAYHHIRVKRCVDSGEIEVYFDDMTEPAMTAKDTTFTWGEVGFGSFDDTGNVDDVKIWNTCAPGE
jgi:hypothetical protein